MIFVNIGTTPNIRLYLPCVPRHYLLNADNTLINDRSIPTYTSVSNIYNKCSAICQRHNIRICKEKVIKNILNMRTSYDRLNTSGSYYIALPSLRVQEQIVSHRILSIRRCCQLAQNVGYTSRRRWERPWPGVALNILAESCNCIAKFRHHS